jgi:hypothetical protein
MKPGKTSTARRKQKRLIDKRTAFLAAFAETCDITESARLVGCDRSLHYDWLDDPDYAARFAKARTLASGALKDDAVKWARKGIFEPLVWQGQFKFATRKRTMCLLEDGTSAFEDELPKGAKVKERRTVKTADGEMLGIYRRSEGLMGKLLSAHLPDEFGATISSNKDDAEPPPFIVTLNRRP